MITITSPANHANFFTPVEIPIFARVVDAVRTTNVEFFAGTNDLGKGVNLGRAAGPPSIFTWAAPDFRLGDIYCLVWTNPAPGSYRLTVVNTGSNEPFAQVNFLSRTSAPVSITVTNSTASTNGSDVISVVASDPVAVSGTNFWVWRDMSNAIPIWSNWPPRLWQYYTNWGPKDAVFTVRRFGDATAPVTIAYTLSGTATNGSNYAVLPNSVTIPAGAAYAVIPVVPIETNAPSSPKTVILTLSSNAAAYSLGHPQRAVAVIVHDWVRLYLPELLGDGSFHLNADGPDGAWFSIQSSADLVNWTTLSTNQVFGGSIDFFDMKSSSNTVHFYQAVAQTNGATQ